MMATSSFQPEALAQDLDDVAQVRRLTTGGNVLREMDFRDCFVELVGYSIDILGRPGLDTDTETYFLVFELGEASLSEILRETREKGESLDVRQLRTLHWSLITICCGLHSVGFVHLDIKPVNIVRFQPTKGPPRWKLIDLDGVMRTGCEVPLSDMITTAIYMPPEVASALMRHQRNPREDRCKVSRLMDVWCLGLCALEAIFLTPVLGPWYDEWEQETGSETKFLKWLADMNTEPIVSGVMTEELSKLDKEMSRMLEGMLTKDPNKRYSIVDCLNSAWMKPMREDIQEKIAQSVALVEEEEDEDEDDDGTKTRNSSDNKAHKVAVAVTRTCAMM
jgi:serine/threonine protein kinase